MGSDKYPGPDPVTRCPQCSKVDCIRAAGLVVACWSLHPGRIVRCPHRGRPSCGWECSLTIGCTVSWQNLERMSEAAKQRHCEECTQFSPRALRQDRSRAQRFSPTWERKRARHKKRAGSHGYQESAEPYRATKPSRQVKNPCSPTLSLQKHVQLTQFCAPKTSHLPDLPPSAAWMSRASDSCFVEINNTNPRLQLEIQRPCEGGTDFPLHVFRRQINDQCPANAEPSKLYGSRHILYRTCE